MCFVRFNNINNTRKWQLHRQVMCERQYEQLSPLEDHETNERRHIVESSFTKMTLMPNMNYLAPVFIGYCVVKSGHYTFFFGVSLLQVRSSCKVFSDLLRKQ